MTTTATGPATIVTAVVDALVAAGIPAVSDQRNLNPPAVLVGEPTVANNRLAGNTATLDLFAVVPATGPDQARLLLEALVPKVRAVWPPTYEYPTALPTIAGGDPLPAVRLTIRVRIC